MAAPPPLEESDDDSDIELIGSEPEEPRALAEAIVATVPPPRHPPYPPVVPQISIIPAAPQISIAPAAPLGISEAPMSRLVVSAFPLAVRDSAPPSSSDRRREERRAAEFDVEFLGDTHFTTGLTQDLSEGGVFIATYQLLPIGTSVSLAFELPGGHRVEARGEVRWIRGEIEDSDTRPGLGVAFTELGPEALARIVEYCGSSPARYYEF